MKECMHADHQQSSSTVSLSQEKHVIIQKTVEHVRTVLGGESSGHDWWHIYRVWNLSKQLAQIEGADLFVVELAALLHDIADWKFHHGDETVGPRVARAWLETLCVSDDVIEHICQIIKDISFKGAGVASSMKTKEGMVVQDADRLDAMGAIGIARCFAYGGYKQRVLYDPAVQPVLHATAQAYKSNDSNSINHFYEKLLLLKDRMNTASGRRMALQRHVVMEHFLEQFLSEWNGQDTGSLSADF